MAKHPHKDTTETTEAVETQTEVAATEEAPAAEAPATAEVVADERFKKITLDADAAKFIGDESKAGTTMNRIDFIRTAWQTAKKARGDIAKELSRVTGKKVPYQIVFSGTKGLAGGPTPTAAPAAEASAQAAEGETAAAAE